MPDFLLIVFLIVIAMIAALSVVTGGIGTVKYLTGMKREMANDRGHADIISANMQHMLFSIMSAIMSPMWKVPGQQAPNQSTAYSQPYNPETENFVDMKVKNDTSYQGQYNPFQLPAPQPSLLLQKRKKDSSRKFAYIMTVLCVFMTLCFVTVLCYK